MTGATRYSGPLRPPLRVKAPKPQLTLREAFLANVSAKGNTMAIGERYQLECGGCQRKIELAAGDPNKPETVSCPRCGASLRIEWRYRKKEVER